MQYFITYQVTPKFSVVGGGVIHTDERLQFVSWGRRWAKCSRSCMLHWYISEAWLGDVCFIFVHFLATQHCFFLSGPPKRGLSMQYLHVPQSSARHPLQWPHRFLFLPVMKTKHRTILACTLSPFRPRTRKWSKVYSIPASDVLGKSFVSCMSLAFCTCVCVCLRMNNI